MIKLSADEDDGLFINRSDIVKSAIDDLKEQIDDTLLVENITNTSVTYLYYGNSEVTLEPEKLIVNISDQEVGLSLKLLTLSLISSKYNQLPKIGILLKDETSDPQNDPDSPIKDGWGSNELGESPVAESSTKEDEDEEVSNLDIVGLSLIDNTGVLYSEISDHEFDFSLEISSNYVKNAFQRNGIISLAYAELDDARKLYLSPKPESFIDPDDLLNDEWNSKHEVSMGTMNASIALQENRKRKKWKRRIRMNRRQDASGHRQRALAARLRWKKFKGKYIRGMKKFNNSRLGKLSQFRKGRKLSLLNKLNVIGRKDER